MNIALVGKFETYISKKDLESLNKIIVNDKISISDRKKILFILTYIKDYDTYKKEVLNDFEEFCSDEQVTNRQSFKELIDNMYHELENMIRKGSKKEDLNLFTKKVSTVVAIGKENLHLEDKKYLKLLNKILMSNIDIDNYELIKVLYSNEIMKQYEEKRIVALEVLFEKTVNYLISDEDLNLIVKQTLTNEDILTLDNDTYRKTVEMVITHVQAYVLNLAINKDLTQEKKKAIIDYYYSVLSKYLPKSMYIEEGKVVEYSKQNIFSVVYNDKLIKMNDESYKQTLENIKESQSPISYVEILMSNIADEYKNIALDIIESGKKTNYDYKELVKDFAVSPVLSKLSLDDYKRLLLSINNFCSQIGKVNNNGKRMLYVQIIKKMSELFNNTELFINNTPRLLLAIELVMTNINANQFDSIIKFCNSQNSIYYTDSQYRRIVDIITKCSKYGYQSELLLELFTNKNVPFMKDKSSLFETARNQDFNAIKDMIIELNIQGNFNNNMYSIFSGLDEDITKEFSEAYGLKVKKIVCPYIPKNN